MVELKFKVVPGVTSVDGATVIVAGKSQPPDPLRTFADLGGVDGAGLVAGEVTGAVTGGAVVVTVVGDGLFPTDRLTNESPDLVVGVLVTVGAGVDVLAGVVLAVVPPGVVMTPEAGAANPSNRLDVMIAIVPTARPARCRLALTWERSNRIDVTPRYRQEFASPFGRSKRAFGQLFDDDFGFVVGALPGGDHDEPTAENTEQAEESEPLRIGAGEREPAAGLEARLRREDPAGDIE